MSDGTTTLEQVEPGCWRASLSLPEPGRLPWTLAAGHEHSVQWRAKVHARLADGADWSPVTKELRVRPARGSGSDPA